MCAQGCQGKPSKAGQSQGVMKAAGQLFGDGGICWRNDGEEVGNFWAV